MLLIHFHHFQRGLFVSRIDLQEIHPVGQLADVKLLLMRAGLGCKLTTQNPTTRSVR